MPKRTKAEKRRDKAARHAGEAAGVLAVTVLRSNSNEERIEILEAKVDHLALVSGIVFETVEEGD